MGNAEGAAKARAKRNPDLISLWSAKGGKSVKKENRAFFINRKLASLAGKKSGEVRRKR